jgi:hypothetical protein
LLRFLRETIPTNRCLPLPAMLHLDSTLRYLFVYQHQTAYRQLSTVLCGYAVTALATPMAASQPPGKLYPLHSNAYWDINTSWLITKRGGCHSWRNRCTGKSRSHHRSRPLWRRNQRRGARSVAVVKEEISGEHRPTQPFTFNILETVRLAFSMDYSGLLFKKGGVVSGLSSEAVLVDVMDLLWSPPCPESVWRWRWIWRGYTRA